MASRIQSAMEYLMTYGWAILIIAVVLGALFGLGFFNSANLAPKVGSGSCQVYRPNGPGTTTFINTEGTCNNELPQYVAQLNGVSSTIVIQSSSSLSMVNAVSLCTWMYPTTFPSNGERFLSKGTGGGGTSSLYYLYIDGAGKLHMAIDDNGWSDSGYQIPYSNMWYFVCGTFDGNNRRLYVNGIQQYVIAQSGTINTNNDPLYFNSNGGSQLFSGSMANAQIYNTSLSANEVAALYNEGIGGDPLVLNSLVGWWPLNGNANDYSGNLNNGVSTSVVYTSSWTSGYSAP